MKHGKRIIWKLNAVVIAIVSVAIAFPTCIDYFLSDSVPDGPRRTILIVGAIVLAVVLCTTLLRIMMRRLIEVPIDNLITGTRRIAEGDLDYRFRSDRNDEIGELEESFNSMTSRIRAHQTELRNAMEYLQGIIESSADIIITVTPWHLIQTFNRGAEQALGYSREEVQGKRIEILFARQEDREKALRRLEHSDNVRNFTTDFKTKDGKTRNVLLTLTRLRDGDGNPIGTFGISKDITEERRLLRQLIRTKKLAAIGEAVTGIQHAIKNMLNALKGGAYLVKSGMRHNKRDRLREGWSMVEEGIERISSLSLSLLNFVNEWKPDYEDVDVADMLSKVYEVVKQSASNKGVELKSDIPGQSPTVRCDSRLVHMAIMDIVSNAIDACNWKEYESSETAEVLLGARYCEGAQEFVVSVTDNGCGMDDEVVQNIFKPFFSTKKKWGTGLGLSLTSRVIEVHGGRIDVESEPGRGTTFRIVLPINGLEDDKESVDGQESPPD